MLELKINVDDYEDLVRQIKGIAELLDGSYQTFHVSLDTAATAPEGDGIETPPTVSDTEPEPESTPSPTKKTIALAEELGIDINSIEGSGKNGRVTQADVKLAAKSKPAETSEGPSTEPEAPATVPEEPPFDEGEATGGTTLDPTKANAAAALRVVHANKGIDGCMAILRDFDANRISDVTDDQYEAFISACIDALEIDPAQMSEKIDRLAGS